MSDIFSGGNVADHAQIAQEYIIEAEISRVLSQISRDYSVRGEGVYDFPDGQVWLVVVGCALTSEVRNQLLAERQGYSLPVEFATVASPVGQAFLEMSKDPTRAIVAEGVCKLEGGNTVWLVVTSTTLTDEMRTQFLAERKVHKRAVAFTVQPSPVAQNFLKRRSNTR